MEISVIGISQTKLGRTDLLFKDGVGFCNIHKTQIFSGNSRISFGLSNKYPKSSIKLCVKAAARSEKGSTDTSTSHMKSHLQTDGVRLYVGLPLDSVSECNVVKHERAIVAGLKALKLLGVDGVELPIWWGVVEKEAKGKYEWSGYLYLAEMVQKMGLKLHVSLCFHACSESKIPLPEWVSQIGESQPSIYYADQLGKHYKDCLSLAVDDLPVLDGNTPIEMYKEFCESFKNTFSEFMGSTITGVTIGLGPDGELRYPSQHQAVKSNKISGAGEFQCYDKNMLNNLKQHAETLGNPLWGLSGPHDASTYEQSPISTNFFKDNGGSWDSPYGEFFLSWYSNQLIAHADRLLSLVSSVFSDSSVSVCGKVPLMHTWYKTRSHPSELTAGFYNTSKRNGYRHIAEVFSRNSSKMILPGMDLLDEHQPNEALSSPQLLLDQITKVCREEGVEVSGQNSLVSGFPMGFEQIKRNLLGEDGVVDLFTYQRMGASFFSPDHFPSFSGFVRSLDQQELHYDDMLANEEEEAASLIPA